MTKIILHVGAYKTATSAIQGFFTTYSSEVREKFNILYPTVFRRVNSGVVNEDGGDSFGHHTLAHLLRNVESAHQESRLLDEQFGALRDEIHDSACTTVFLSTELLTFCSKATKERILDGLADYDLKVVYAVRNPIDFIESLHNQRLKSGVGLRVRVGGVEFLQNIDEWCELVTEARVEVLPFASSVFSAFVEDFFGGFDAPGLTDFAASRLPRANKAASAETAFARQAMNDFLPSPGQMRPSLRHAVNQAVARLDADLSRRTRLWTLSGPERDRISNENGAQMEEICRRFIPEQRWSAVLHTEAAGAPTDAGAVVYTAADLRRVLECFVTCGEILSGARAPKAAVSKRTSLGRARRARRRAMT